MSKRLILESKMKTNKKKKCKFVEWRKFITSILQQFLH